MHSKNIPFLFLVRKNICCVTVYLLGSVKEVACIRNFSWRVAFNSEGWLETKADTHSQGERLNAYCANIFY